MRLKGGKVLLDLTEYDIRDDITKAITQEEVNAIIEKGVVVKIRYDKTLLYYPLLPSSFNIDNGIFNMIVYNYITIREDNDTRSWSISLDIENNGLSFTEQ